MFDTLHDGNELYYLLRTWYWHWLFIV